MRGEFIDVGGEAMYYYAAGTRGAGSPIVLVHGVPTSGHIWGNLVSQLPQGRRVVVPDLIGHGRSALGARADLTIAGHARRLGALLDLLGIREVALVGHHAGALIAGMVATEQPRRVTHLALVNPIGGDVAFTGTLAVVRAFLPAARLLPPALVRRWIRRELWRWYGDPARARISVDQFLLAVATPPRWHAFLRQIRAITPVEVQRCTDELRAVRMPVAIVAGSDDPAAPPAAIDRLRNALPHATLDIIRDGRHFSPEESPEQVGRVVGDLICS